MSIRKSIKLALIGALILVCSVMTFAEELPTTYHPATDAYEGWRLGAQAYTFNRYTFYEALDKMASLGLDWVEMYPGQVISKDDPNMKTTTDMPAEKRAEIKARLKEYGMTLVNYGVISLPNDEKECRKVFDFCKDMGIETIASEPPEEAFDLIDKLCQEYKINVAIHNHPKPSHYWDPETVLKVCKGRSKYIGAMGDTGHWMRSGIDPKEAIEKLGDRLIALHFKDLNSFGRKDAHDVQWGTGKADVKGIMELLHKQGYKGTFSIEYEHNWEYSVPEIRDCVKYFNHVAQSLNPSGWKCLLKCDLSNAVMNPGAWTWENGELTWHHKGYIWTEERYGDFILDVEYKVSEGANSGVFFRCSDLDNTVHTSIEVQVHETSDGARIGMCGAIYDVKAPKVQNQKKANEWNHYTITCKDNMIWVVQNGEQIVEMDLNDWTEAGKNPDGTPNKFKYAYKDMVREGHIGFQDHGQPVWFRNLKIKEL